MALLHTPVFFLNLQINGYSLGKNNFGNILFLFLADDIIIYY